MSKIKQIAWTACGTTCVVLGVIGMFLPILPTTPFLLLAAFCYARSSRRFYDWLVTNRWCGAYIRNYREGHGIARQHKAGVILLLWLTIGGTVGFAVSLWWVRLILIAIAVAVTVHVLKIRTYRPTPCRPGATGVQAPPSAQAMIAGAIEKRKGLA
ncbi:MAG: YbaN family protein [Kiritimatiellae bacterium]|nr:YbaN family protein [Kiritimatiellia bacterium]